MEKMTRIAIDDLHAYENNPRRIPSQAVKAVAESIRQFGFKVPIIIDKDNVIVGGHTRVLAARELGLEEVPCIVADDLTPEQIRAFRLVDNKTCELTGWDFEKLDMELAELDIDMSDFGFEAVGEDIDTGAFFTETGTVEQAEHSGKSREIICPECGAKIMI